MEEEKSTYEYFNIRCPISHEIMLNPHVAEDGHTYEYLNMKKWFGKSETYKSPLTNKSISDDLFPNLFMKHMIDKFRNLMIRVDSEVLRFSKKVDASGKLKNKVLAEDKEQALHLKGEAIKHYYGISWKLSDCIAQLEEAHKLFPTDPQILLEQANMLRFNRKWDEALEVLEKMQYLMPGLLSYKSMKIRIYAERGEKDRAFANIDEILFRHPIDSSSLEEVRSLCHALESTQNYVLQYLILSTYSKILDDDRNSVACLCRALSKMGKEAECLVMVQNYLSRHEPDADFLFHQAEAQSKLDMKPDAEGTYKQILKLDIVAQEKAYVHIQLAFVQPEMDLMEEHFKKSYDLDPKEDGDAYLACLYVRQNKSELAQKWLDIACQRVDINNDTYLLKVKAKHMENSGKGDEAINTYLRLSELDSKNAQHYHLEIERLLDFPPAVPVADNDDANADVDADVDADADQEDPNVD